MKPYTSPRAISGKDETGEFHSTDDSLNNWLKKFAVTNSAGGGARVFVTTPTEEPTRVVGYYSLSSASIAKADATIRVGKTMPDPIPALLLGRLAVDKDYAGIGLGKHLLRDAITRSVQVAEQIGIRALIVHALDADAASFYMHFEFEPSVLDPLHLMLMMKDARALFS